jgi:signal transduction histidine kinase
MLRLSLMAGGILLVVAALVIAAIFMGLDAKRQQHRAEAAEQQSKDQLWKSYRDQACALRRSGLQGSRLDGMAVLAKAAAGWNTLHGGERIDPPDQRELREEAAALLALPDLSVSRAPFAIPPGEFLTAADEAQGLLATSDSTGNIVVRRITDGQETVRLAPGKKFSSDLIITGLEWRPIPGAASGRSWLCAWFKNGEVAMWVLPEAAICFHWHPGAPLMGGGPSPGHFSADGRYMAFFTGQQSRLNIVEMDSGKMMPHTLPAGRTAFAIRPRVAEIALYSQSSVQLLDIATGALKHKWPVPVGMHTLAWSRDGSRLAGMGWNGDIFILNTNSATTRTLGGHTGRCRVLAFSPDGRTLMSSADDNTTRWWDPERGSILLTSQSGQGLSYGKDGRTICYMANAGGIGQWESVPSLVHQSISVPGGPDADITRFDLSPDGRWLASVVDWGWMLWSTENPAKVWPMLQPGLSALVFTPDGGLVMIASGKIAARKLTLSPEGVPGIEALSLPALGIPEGTFPQQLSPGMDGRSLLLEMGGGAVGTADLKGERPFRLLHSHPFLGMGFGKSAGSTTGSGRFVLSPDGRYAAFAYGMEKGATVYDTVSGEMVWTSKLAGGVALFSPDGKRLLISHDIKPRNILTESWVEEKTHPVEWPPTGTGAIAITGDGQLAAFDTNPQTMTLSRAGDLSPLLTLVSPGPRNIRNSRMAHDGSQLVISCSGNEFQVWNLKALRVELGKLGLNWNDAAITETGAAVIPLSLPPGSWSFAVWLGAAALAAGGASVVMLKRHHGLMRDFAGAEIQLGLQRQDLEHANTSLLHSQKMKALGTLAAGMAHDFNNLLSVIRMSNKLISRETKGNPEVTELSESVESAVLQGKKVVSSMLSYSREDTGPARPVTAVVRDTAALLSTEFLSGITLSLDLDDATPFIEVPAGRIEQILLNLIVNASEAMAGNGHLKISVRPAPPEAAALCVLPPRPAPAYVEIAVRDTGPGVPEEIADRIFEPFFTTKNAGNDRGNGLGLSMVYTIAERDGLGLALRTVAGSGTTFSIIIPVFAGPVRETPTDNPAVMAVS